MHIQYIMEDAEMQINPRKAPRHPAIIYLGEYRSIKQRISALQSELEDIRENATRATSRITAERISGTGKKDGMANAAIRAVDVERRLETLIDHQRDCLDMRLFLIEQMDNESEKLVLTLRYIRCMRWEDIAREIHYGLTATYELHGRALQNFWRVYQERSKTE